MADTPDKGESLSEVRRRAGRTGWDHKAATPIIPKLPPVRPPAPVQLTLVADNPQITPAPKVNVRAARAVAQLAPERAERLSQVTNEAIDAYNRILGRPAGMLPSVRIGVGVQARRAQVQRVIITAREICQHQYGDPHITPEFWDRYFTEAKRDDFYSGRITGGRDHENYKPDFELLTRPKTMLRLFDKAVSRAG